MDIMKENKVFTHKDYLDGLCTHREYYGQFVTSYIRGVVLSNIGKDKIKKSADEHFNDIPLKLWDRLPLGRSGSLSQKVCIAKEAARQIKGTL